MSIRPNVQACTDRDGHKRFEMSNISESNVKQCCATFYGSDLARLLLGESFHPGGTALTERLGQLMQLTRDSRVLDVAAGRGTSAFHLARSFGCEITGVDLNEDNVKLATQESAKRGLADRVSFRIADAETLPFEACTFDAILCECALCTFPNKRAAAAEFSRVLKPAGRLGLSDLTRITGPLPELDGLLSWIACIGDARPVEEYVETLQHANFAVAHIEEHSPALTELVRQIQGRLLGAEIVAGLKKLDVPDLHFSDAKRFAEAALRAVKDGKLGYIAIAAVRLR
jgi:ubiquinone/menaquinone biosynthesis C-methylase UbiE